MKLITILMLLFLSQPAIGAECNKEKALEIGLEAIKKNFKDYKDDEPYKVMEYRGNWAVYGTLPEGWRGGTPQAFIDKTTCKIIKINHGR